MEADLLGSLSWLRPAFCFSSVCTLYCGAYTDLQTAMAAANPSQPRLPDATGKVHPRYSRQAPPCSTPWQDCNGRTGCLLCYCLFGPKENSPRPLSAYIHQTAGLERPHRPRSAGAPPVAGNDVKYSTGVSTHPILQGLVTPPSQPDLTS